MVIIIIIPFFEMLFVCVDPLGGENSGGKIKGGGSRRRSLNPFGRSRDEVSPFSIQDVSLSRRFSPKPSSIPLPPSAELVLPADVSIATSVLFRRAQEEFFSMDNDIPAKTAVRESMVSLFMTVLCVKLRLCMCLKEVTEGAYYSQPLEYKSKNYHLKVLFRPFFLKIQETTLPRK